MRAALDDNGSVKPAVAISERLWASLAIRFGAVSFITTILVVIGTQAYFYVTEYLIAEADGPEGKALLREYYAWLTGFEGPSASWLGVPLRFLFYDALTLLLLMSPLALCLSLIGATLVARKITQPISEIGLAARKIVNGNLSTRVDTSARVGSSELRALIDDFNALAGSLEHAEQSVRRDAASIAHELRTPITVLNFKLRGFIDGVIAPSDEQFRILLEQTELLSRIVGDLRTVSLAASGDLPLNRKPVDLNDLARSVLAVQRERLKEAGIKAELLGEPVEVQADRDRIGQALANLVENAIRYAAAGEVLDITTSRDGEDAIIEVSDRGPGLTSSLAPMVFHPFSRGDESRSREHGGSGLGLSVVAAIVSAHSGSVVASPRPGGGLSVSVILPIAAAPDNRKKIYALS
jgi:two-component system sensor histidine kinase AdeS